MALFNDIYCKINSQLIENEFENLNFDLKKELIDQELKNYLTFKIKILTQENFIPIDLNPNELFQLLVNEIPKKYHDETLSNIIYYILYISSVFQFSTIIWIVEDNPSFIETPIIELNEFNYYDLKTNLKTDYAKIFNVVYNFFQHELKDNFQLTKK